MTASWLRHGGKMPPSDVTRTQAGSIFRSHRASFVDGSAQKPNETRGAFLAAPALASKPSAGRR